MLKAIELEERVAAIDDPLDAVDELVQCIVQGIRDAETPLQVRGLIKELKLNSRNIAAAALSRPREGHADVQRMPVGDPTWQGADWGEGGVSVVGGHGGHGAGLAQGGTGGIATLSQTQSGPIVRSILATKTETQQVDSAIMSNQFLPPDNSLLICICTSVGPNPATSPTIVDSLGGEWEQLLNRVESDARSSHVTVWMREIGTAEPMTVECDTNDGTGQTSSIVQTVLAFEGYDPEEPIRQTFLAGEAAYRTGAYSANMPQAPLVDSLVIAVAASDMQSWSGGTYAPGTGWAQLFEAGQLWGGCLVQERGGSASKAVKFASMAASFSWIAAAIEIKADDGTALRRSTEQQQDQRQEQAEWSEPAGETRHEAQQLDQEAKARIQGQEQPNRARE